MRLQRKTLALLSLALLSTGMVYLVEYQGRLKTEENQQQQQVFTFEETQVKTLRIMTQQETLIFERQASGSNPVWRMKSPINQPASDAAIAFLLSKLVKLKSDRSIVNSSEQLLEYGLNSPNAVVEVTLENQELHRLVVGRTDFTQSFLYAQANPNPETKPRVILIPKDFEYAINRPLPEWQPSTLEIPQLNPNSNPNSNPESSPTQESPNPEPSPQPETP